MKPNATHRDDWDQHWTSYEATVAQNPAQAMRRRVIHSLLGLGNEPARILDLGCGQGELLAEMAARYPRAELRGMDFSQRGLEMAAAKVPQAVFTHRDLLTPSSLPPEQRGWATHAICSEVLEHVDNPGTLLEQGRQYLAPGCRLVVTVPGGPMSAFDRHIGHRRHYTAGALHRLLVDAGFSVDRATGIGFPLFNLYRLAVVARGHHLVDDVGGELGDAPVSAPARLAMGVFRALLALPQPRNQWGWQIAAVAHVGE